MIEPVRNYIYVLCESDGQTIRYVGRAKNLHVRYSGHQTSAREHGRFSDEGTKDEWVYSLLEQGTRPIMRVVDVSNEKYSGPLLEGAWKKYLDETGHQLLNRQPIPIRDWEFLDISKGDYFEEKLRFALSIPATFQEHRSPMPIHITSDLRSGIDSASARIEAEYAAKGFTISVSPDHLCSIAIRLFLDDAERKLKHNLIE